MDEEKVGIIEKLPLTTKADEESLLKDFTQNLAFDLQEENSMQQQENFKQSLQTQKPFLDLNLLKINNVQNHTKSDEMPEFITSDQNEKNKENNIKTSISTKKSNLKLKIPTRTDAEQEQSNDIIKDNSYSRTRNDSCNSEVSYKELPAFVQQDDTEQYSSRKKRNCRSKHEYLAQLLRDKSQVLKYPDAFLHVEKILDKEINKVRMKLISESTTNSTFLLPEPKGKIVLLQEKVFVPVKDYPEYNFVGRILGPRGMTVKQLQVENACKIMIRGSGSLRDKEKEKAFKGLPSWKHLEEDLHVLISVEDYENRAIIKLSKAVEDVKKLLILPAEGEDKFKKLQLMELAIINGTYREHSRGRDKNNNITQVVSPRLLERAHHPHNFVPKNPSNQHFSRTQTNFQNPPFGSYGRPPSITTPILLTPRTPAFFPAPGVLETPTLLRHNPFTSTSADSFNNNDSFHSCHPGLAFHIDPEFIAVHHSPFLEYALNDKQKKINKFSRNGNKD